MDTDTSKYHRVCTEIHTRSMEPSAASSLASPRIIGGRKMTSGGKNAGQRSFRSFQRSLLNTNPSTPLCIFVGGRRASNAHRKFGVWC